MEGVSSVSSTIYCIKDVQSWEMLCSSVWVLTGTLLSSSTALRRESVIHVPLHLGWS